MVLLNFKNLLPRLSKKEPWQIVAARYCVDNSEQGFSLDELKSFIHERYSVHDAHVMQFIEEELQLPSGRTYSRNGKEGKWMPPLDLVSKVTDYDELKEARRNSKNAFWLSIIAIAISAITLLVTIFQGC